MKITTEIQDHIFLIGFNRPEKLNAADEEMLQQLSRAYAEADNNPNIRAVVVFNHGDHFTAGLDLNDLGPKMATGSISMVPEGGLDPWGVTTKQISKPVVMAIKGTCFTLGTELALASDVVIAEPNSLFGQLEVSRAILPFGGGTIRFPRSAGWQNAMRYLLTADTFDASVAKEMGIVSEISDNALETAKEIATRISQQAPLAVMETLASARNSVTDEDLEKPMLAKRLGKLMQTADVQRGMQAFITKQPAKFEGN